MMLARLSSAAAGTLIVGWLVCPASFAQSTSDAAKPKTLWEQKTGTGENDWSKYTVDTSGASISAFSLLDVPTDHVATVENVRDVTLAVKGFGSNSTGFGVSITPARTSIEPFSMNLSTYAGITQSPDGTVHKSPLAGIYRLLGALTLGYAQGTTAIAGADFQRQAISLQTNYFFRDEDDPIIAVATKTRDCPILGPVPPGMSDEDWKKEVEKINARADACRKEALDNLAKVRWNRSQVSASFATGWIHPETGPRGKESLGRTAALGLTYGFDGIGGPLERNAALYLTLRRSVDEPVLETLNAADIEHKSSTLAVLRMAGGWKTLRGIAEVSNAHSTDVTATQRAFKRALGADYRIAEGTWLNFRIGKQRTIDGSREETTSLISLSYSPSQLLK